MRTVFLIAAILLFASIAIGHPGHAPLLTRGATIDPATGILRLSREAREILDLRTAEVAERVVEGRWFAYASIQSPWNSTAFVSPQIAGRIVALHVQPGEKVEKGQLLAELDSQELQQLRLTLLTAKNQHDLAENTERRLTAAANAGAVAGQQLLEAQNQAAQSANALEVAKRQWQVLGLSKERLESLLSGNDTEKLLLPIRAPIGGTINHADLSVGKIVDPKEHIFEIVDLTSMWLRIQVLERDLTRAQIGQPVIVTLNSHPGRKWSATIDRISNALDASTHLAAAWATLSNVAGEAPTFMPGMTGQAQLGESLGSAALAVPASSVLRDGADRFVLIEQTSTNSGSEFKKQSVVLGTRSGAWVEVKGGTIFPGDRVVTQGGHELAGFFTQGTLTLSPETAKDIGLVVKPVAAASIHDVFEADGAVDVPADRRSVVASPLSGVIERIRIDRSAVVHAGDVIADIRSVEFQKLQIELLRASLEQNLQATVLERVRSSGESIAKRRIIEVEAAEREARFRVDGARQTLRTIGLTDQEISVISDKGELLPLLPLRASIAGVVVGFDKVLGHVVRSDEPLFEIHDLSQPFVEAFVAERDAAKVHVGQAVRLRLVSDPEAVLSGRVVRLGHTLGATARTLSAWIEVEGDGMGARPHNALTRITFSGGARSAPMAVPVRAILHEGNRAYVFVQSADGAFARRPVSLGRTDDLSVEILRGLAVGEKVAVRGVSQLQTGYAAIR